MKGLKAVLISVYVILVILLLLGMNKCCPDHATTTSADLTPTDSTVRVVEQFKADVVMCIDCTASMSGIINTIKSNALRFYSDVRRKCAEHGKEIQSMRIKVIGFRDVTHDPNPFMESDFFNMPSQESVFRSFVSGLSPVGGGDTPESGYDALYMAIKSPWHSDSDTHQIIIIWTDAPSRESLGAAKADWLKQCWDEMNPRGKRLILFTPDEPSWSSIEREWDNTKHYDVRAGAGLSDVEYEEIIKTLAESM